jgi:hypothetical protein
VGKNGTYLRSSAANVINDPVSRYFPPKPYFYLFSGSKITDEREKIWGKNIAGAWRWGERRKKDTMG